MNIQRPDMQGIGLEPIGQYTIIFEGFFGCEEFFTEEKTGFQTIDQKYKYCYSIFNRSNE